MMPRHTACCRACSAFLPDVPMPIGRFASDLMMPIFKWSREANGLVIFCVTTRLCRFGGASQKKERNKKEKKEEKKRKKEAASVFEVTLARSLKANASGGPPCPGPKVHAEHGGF